MCCIFTCCGWMIDLVQRLWTFTMSCCISSAVCCVLMISSMAGIALGYNYSLAEYIDLKETNVSIYLKRGIFEDEIADVEWRRAGHLPVRGHIDETNLRTGPPANEDSTTLRSGRRLDDSVFETGGEQNKYEGSLMRLTAKPPYSSTPPHWVTPDDEMNSIATSYPKDSLDSLKAIQGLIDSRRAMANRMSGGTTLSPVPTYPFNEAERMYQNPGGRRMMPNYDYNRPPMNPARLAVPNQQIGARINWRPPKEPELWRSTFKDLELEFDPTTYPSPITFRTGPIRPTLTASTEGRDAVYLTNTSPITLFSTAPPDVTTAPRSVNDIDTLKDKLLMDNEMPPRRKSKPKSDEEYDYEIKGLPVRKRRSIKFGSIYNKDMQEEIKNSTVKHKTSDSEESVEIDSHHNIFRVPVTMKYLIVSYMTNKIVNKNQNNVPDIHKVNNVEQNDHSTLQAKNVKRPIDFKRHTHFPQENKTEIFERKNMGYGNKLLTYITLKIDSMKKILLKHPQSNEPNISREININNHNDTVQTEKVFVSEKDSRINVTVKPEKTVYLSTEHMTLRGREPSNAIENLYEGTERLKPVSSTLVQMILTTIA